MDGAGRRDPAFGASRELVSAPAARATTRSARSTNLAAADGITFGVLKLRLRPRDYDLAFVPVDGGCSATRSAGQACHRAAGSD